MSWRQLKHFCEGPPQYGLNVGAGEYTDEGVRLLRTTDIQEDGTLVRGKAGVFLPPDMVESRYLLRKGDLLFSRAGSLGRCFRVTTTTEPLTFAGYLVRFRPVHDVEPRYLQYCAATRFFQGRIEADAITSTISNFNAERYGNLLIPDRDQAEQRTIADFLDTETARIDALITKKRRLLKLVNERLTSQIDGLMPFLGGVSFENGGDVSFPPLSAVIQIAEGQVDPRRHPYSELPLIAPNHVESGTGRIHRVETAAEQGATSGKYVCNAGDVIYSKIRPALRKVCVAPSRCLTSADMYPMRPLADLCPNYLFYFLLSERFTDFAILESERVAMPKINRDALGRIRIPLPSVAEQMAIVSRLDGLRRWAGEVGSRLTHQIDLLEEHRQATITAAVTGDLDVPGVAA